MPTVAGLLKEAFQGAAARTAVQPDHYFVDRVTDSGLEDEEESAIGF